MTKANYLIIILSLVLSSSWLLPSYIKAHDSQHNMPSAYDYAKAQSEANRRLLESAEIFSQNMKEISDRAAEKRFQSAMNDLFDLIKDKGAYGVSVNDVYIISQKRDLNPTQTKQLIGFLQQARDLESSQ